MHEIKAVAEGIRGDGSWLSGLKGKAAVGKYLFAATDEGIVRLERRDANIEITRKYPDTERFVDESCHILPGREGLYIVKQREIVLLQFT